MVRINPPPSTTQGSTIQFIFLHYRFFTVELYSFIIESSMFFKVIRRIFGDICKLSLQALDSTQSTIFACLQASSSQLSLEYSRIWLRWECLEDFPLSEHQNIRKAVLCVLPKEFCVRRSGNDSRILLLWRIEVAETRSSGGKAKRSILCVCYSALSPCDKVNAVYLRQISPKVQGLLKVW